jgi:hypothetical protein
MVIDAKRGMSAILPKVPSPVSDAETRSLIVRFSYDHPLRIIVNILLDVCNNVKLVAKFWLSIRIAKKRIY